MLRHMALFVPQLQLHRAPGSSTPGWTDPGRIRRRASSLPVTNRLGQKERPLVVVGLANTAIEAHSELQRANEALSHTTRRTRPLRLPPQQSNNSSSKTLGYFWVLLTPPRSYTPSAIPIS